jgi:Reverse transcriptase (RNA-dependent DNA polymerase).
LSLNEEETDDVKIGRGVRQGCCMSPLLFNVYGEYLMKEGLLIRSDLKMIGYYS